MTEIPIQNIYYLLSYAWDYLPEADEIEIVAKDCHSVDELFARILSNGVQHLLRRGLDRDYVLHREETGRLRGRFDLTASFSRQTMQAGRMVCEFDELSHDVLHNRILRTTLELLSHNPNLADETSEQIHRQLQVLAQVSPVRITSRLFRRLRLHRNNRDYRLLMNVCELVHETLLPTEDKGESRFRDFIRDENQMPRLFEAFVRNFYRRHTDFEVSAARLRWQVEAEEETMDLVPRLETDVSLVSPDRQIILDCKFYGSAFSSRHGKTRFKRNDLFQLFAYLENAGPSKGWLNVEGVLLYPAVSEGFRHCMTLNSHPLMLCSVDLDREWVDIRRNLIKICEASAAAAE